MGAGLGHVAVLVGGIIGVIGVGDEEIEVPEPDVGVFGILDILIRLRHARLAEAVTAEAGVDVDEAGLFGEVFGDGVFVEVVDAADEGVDIRSEFDAEVGCRRYPRDVEILVVAPGIVVGAKELRIAGEVEEKIGVRFNIHVIEDIVDGVDEILA